MVRKTYYRRFAIALGIFTLMAWQRVSASGQDGLVEQTYLNLLAVKSGQQESLSDGGGALINELRGMLFRKKENILDFYAVRIDIFQGILERQRTRYMQMQNDPKMRDSQQSDQAFEAINRLEIKVSQLRQRLRSSRKQLFEERAKSQFLDLLARYKQESRKGLEQDLAIKIQMLDVLLQAARAFNYPEKALQSIEEKRKGLGQLATAYGHWEKADQQGGEWMSVDDPAYVEQLPVRPKDDSNPEGRKNYITNVTTKNNDKRLLDHRRNVENIDARAPIFDSRLKDRLR